MENNFKVGDTIYYRGIREFAMMNNGGVITDGTDDIRNTAIVNRYIMPTLNRGTIVDEQESEYNGNLFIFVLNNGLKAYYSEISISLEEKYEEVLAHLREWLNTTSDEKVKPLIEEEIQKTKELYSEWSKC